MIIPTENYPHGRATIRQAVDFVDKNEHRVFNRVVLSSDDGQEITIDELLGALLIIDPAHHEVHEGDHFEYDNAQDLGNSATVSFTIVTPDTARWSHFGFEVNGEAEFDILFYEGATGLTSVGTPVTNPAVINNNRNSTTVNTLIINESPVLGAGSKGTLLKHHHAGSGKLESGQSGTGQELILKQNTIYWVDLTNATTSNNYIDWLASWYEAG